MKVIEFLGMPKAGKTTAIDVAESYLKREGKRVRTVYEGARISPLDKEDRFMYNSWSFHNTINRVLEARLDNYDFILVDRGVLDHLAFWKVIHPTCSKYNYQNVYDYFANFLELEDLGLLFMVQPQEAIKRERKNNLFLGRVFDINFLQKLYCAYQDTLKGVKGWDKKLININGSNPLKINLKRVVDIFKELKGGK